MFSNFDLSGYLLQVLYSLPAILVALSFHEWAHAYAAFRLGDSTARNLGRMTVNPLAHVDPIGFVMLLVVRFGWAKPVPINTRNFAHPRRDELIVSLAGVAANLVLAFLFTGVWCALLVLGVQNEIADNMLQYCFVINISLLVFNLIPVPPLDGYHVLQCLFMRKTGYKPFLFLEKYGFVLLIGILLLNSRIGFLSTVVQAVIGLFLRFYMWLFGLFI